MAVYVTEPKPSEDLRVHVLEKPDGSVELRHNGHAFARLYTDEKGEHVIDVQDIDTGSVLPGKRPAAIRPLCWRR